MQASEEDLATSRQTLGPARSVLSVACRPSRGAKPKLGKNYDKLLGILVCYSETNGGMLNRNPKTNHFSPSVRFSLLSSKIIIAHLPLPLMCEAAGVFLPQQDSKQMLSDDIYAEVSPLSSLYAFCTRS